MKSLSLGSAPGAYSSFQVYDDERGAATCPVTGTSLVLVGSYSENQSGFLIHPTGGTSPFETASIALCTFGRPYPYCRSHPGLAGHGSFASPGESDAVARTTCTASAFVSGRAILPCSAAVFPYASTIAITPPTVGVDSLVEPPVVDAVNTLCVPQLVSPERAR